MIQINENTYQIKLKGFVFFKTIITNFIVKRNKKIHI